MSLLSALGDWPTGLHLLRPQWLWALLALPLLYAWWRRRTVRHSAWRAAVDPHLLPHLLEPGGGRRGHAALALGLLAYALAVLALSGPSWRQVEQPAWQTRAPLVVALDLSSASTATDLPPSRLLQARAKLATLLRERSGGQVALVAYAGDAFTVAPLTDDAANVALFLDALEPSVMPVDGQRGDRAIAWSLRLLRQAGFDQGDILLMTDHADPRAIAAAAEARRQGYRVSALGLGSAAGSAYRTGLGAIAHARLDAGSLQALASEGGGAYAALAPGDGDLAALGVLDPAHTGGSLAGGSAGRQWQDQGYWLLLPLLLLALPAFRRGAATAAVLLCLWLPLQPVPVAAASVAPASASAPAAAPASGALWRRPDQQAHARMRAGIDAYRGGDFEAAARAFASVDSADGHYNRGNALAKAGRYREAIAAYERALALQPGMPDALANKAAVEAFLQRQPPPGPRQQQRGRDRDGDGGEPGDARGQGERKPGEGDDAPEQPPPGESSAPSEPTDPADPPGAQDAERQQQADAAMREALEREREQAARQQAAREAAGKARQAAAAADPDETPEQRERRLANQAWLQRVPDDPGGLLRRKFALEYARRQRQGDTP
jgi:Ca-activated chloride channel homolog